MEKKEEVLENGFSTMPFFVNYSLGIRCKKREGTMKLFFLCLMLVCTSCSYLNEQIGSNGEKVLEEVVEDTVKVETGVDVTPIVKELEGPTHAS